MRTRTRVARRRRTRAISWAAAALTVAGSLMAVSTAASRAEAKTTVVQRTAMSATASTATTPLWSTQLDFDDNGTPWSEASFAALKADGLTTAEIDMPWNTIEPSQGTFSFTELDQELANAAAAGIKLVPIFWYSGWGGSPAAWVTSHEVNSSGARGTAPAWWDPTAEPAYVTYVTDTVKHIAGEAGYGGSILNYGELDSQLNDGNGNAGGWAAADVTEFRNVYLPGAYGSIGAFNTAGCAGTPSSPAAVSPPWPTGSPSSSSTTRRSGSASPRCRPSGRTCRRRSTGAAARSATTNGERDARADSPEQ